MVKNFCWVCYLFKGHVDKKECIKERGSSKEIVMFLGPLSLLKDGYLADVPQ